MYVFLSSYCLMVYITIMIILVKCKMLFIIMQETVQKRNIRRCKSDFQTQCMEEKSRYDYLKQYCVAINEHLNASSILRQFQRRNLRNIWHNLDIYIINVPLDYAFFNR